MLIRLRKHLEYRLGAFQGYRGKDTGLRSAVSLPLA